MFSIQLGMKINYMVSYLTEILMGWKLTFRRAYKLLNDLKCELLIKISRDSR